MLLNCLIYSHWFSLENKWACCCETNMFWYDEGAKCLGISTRSYHHNFIWKKKLYVLVRKTISSLAKNKLASPNDAPEGSKNSLSFSICCRFAFLCPFLVLDRNSHSSRFISSCRCSNPMHHWVLFSHVCYCSFPCRLFNELSFQLVLVFKLLVVCSMSSFSVHYLFI